MMMIEDIYTMMCICFRCSATRMGDSVTARRSSHDKVVVVSPGPGPRQPNKLHYHERINKIRDNIRYSWRRIFTFKKSMMALCLVSVNPQ